MKHIVKKPEPIAFTNWKSNRDAPADWKSFDGTDMKQTVKAALLEEQGGLCCYCEIGVNANHGHIEHFLPRSEHPELVLEYGNMLYSCPEKARKDRIPQTCGHAKGDKVLSVSPLNEDCETYFTYSADGKICGQSDTARETIRILNLNGSHRICNRRQNIYEETRESKNILTSDEFDQWINNELARQPDGTFKPFWTTRKYAAGLYT